MKDHVWTTHSTTDGRVYYYNSQTKLSSWTKPEELLTPKEKTLAASYWKEYTTETGRRYYYNWKTKITSWNLPEELAFEQRQQRQNLEKDDAKASQDAQSLQKNQQKKTSRRTGIADPSADAMATFKRVLVENGIKSSQTWNEALPLIAKKPGYRSIGTLIQRKAAFERYIKDLRRTEEIQARERLKTDRERLLGIISGDDRIKATTSYGSFCKYYENNRVFLSIQEDNRKVIYSEYIDNLERTEREALREEKKAGISKFEKIINNLVEEKKITPETCWKDVEELYKGMDEYKNDPKLKLLDEEDFLSVFKGAMDGLMSALKSDRHKAEKEAMQKERQNRQSFYDYLMSLVASGQITHKTVWLDIQKTVEEHEAYKALLSQEGATPVNIFGEVMYNILGDFMSDVRNIETLIGVSCDIKIKHDSSPEEITTIISQIEGINLPLERIRSIVDELIKIEVENHEVEGHRQEERHLRKKIDAFKKCLSKNVQVKDPDMSWKEARTLVKDTPEYKALDSKTRQSVFYKYVLQFENGYKRHSSESPKHTSKHRYHRHRSDKDRKSKSESRRHRRSSRSDHKTLSSKTSERGDSAEEGEVR